MMNKQGYEREKAELAKNKEKFQRSEKCNLCGIIMVGRIAFKDTENLLPVGEESEKNSGLYCKTCWDNRDAIKDYCCCCERRLTKGLARYKANGNFCLKCNAEASGSVRK